MSEIGKIELVLIFMSGFDWFDIFYTTCCISQMFNSVALNCVIPARNFMRSLDTCFYMFFFKE